LNTSSPRFFGMPETIQQTTHSLTSQNTWILSCTAERTSDLSENT